MTERYEKVKETKMNLPRNNFRKFGNSNFRSIFNIPIAFSIIFLFTFSTLRAERLPIKTYMVADGLLRDTVTKIKQDSQGFLWFCTFEGISRFDGYGFTNFTVADGLPDGEINDFLETKDGTIYLATNQGIAKLNPKGIRKNRQTENSDNPLFTVLKPENPDAKRIESLFEDESGIIWVGTGNGLYKLNGQNEFAFVNLSEKQAQPDINTIIKDRCGSLWIGTEESGIFRVSKNGKIENFTTENGLPQNNVTSFLEDSNGRIWIGNGRSGGGISILFPELTQDKKIVERNFTVKDGLTPGWINSILQTSNGEIWIAATGGLCRWQGENAKEVCRTYNEENELDIDVWTILEDKDGNLWTGSRNGAKKLARYGFATYGEKDGIPEIGINSIFENHDGEFFVTITEDSRKIYRFGDNGKFIVARQNISNIKYFGWGIKQTVWQDLQNSWLVPTGFGLYKYSPETKFENLADAVPEKFSPTTKGAEIFRVFEDSRGDIWIATTSANDDNGLYRWERETKTWHDHTAQMIPGENRIVSSFAEDGSGNVWIGTGANGGAELIRYRAGEFRIFTEKDDLPNGWIRDIYVDHLGRLWLANNKNGVLRLDDVNVGQLSFTRYSTNDGLSSVGAYCVTEDAYGRIYIGSARGVDRLNPDSGQVENFTTADGLPASFVEISFRDKQNNLWFGTSKGLTKFIPEPFRKRNPPSILLTALRIGGEAQSVSILGENQISNIELDSAQRQVSVDFVGLGASLGEHLKYEYRLGNADWTQTDERTVNFANLSAGNYKFEVRAVSADRIYSSNPGSVSFKIAAPVYLRWWFLILATAIIALMIFSVYRYRLNKLLEIERTRTRIASDLHDDIGTNLSKISLLSEIVNLQLAEQNNESKNLLNSIAEISRESVSSMSDIVWAINPQRDSFAELVRRMRLHVEEIFLDREVAVVFDSPETSDDSIKLSMNARRELYLIFKEAVSNAARHSNCSRIEIKIRPGNNFIFLQISDDGKGFDVTKKSDGNGLENMRRRAEKSGGNFSVESEKGRGTALTIRFPIN